MSLDQRGRGFFLCAYLIGFQSVRLFDFLGDIVAILYIVMMLQGKELYRKYRLLKACQV